MKKIAFILLLLLFPKAYSQIAYNDAVELRSMVVNGKFDVSGTNESKLVAILSNYVNKTENDKYNLDDIKSEIGEPLDPKNPYLSQFMPNNGQTIANVTGIKSFLGSVGNTPVTNFADGLAKFLVNRTKKELQAAFFDRFIEDLKKDEFKDIQTLFPATFHVVKRLPIDVYNYEPYILELREAFGKDLQVILPNIEYVIKNGKFRDFFNNHLELKSVSLTALYFGNGLLNKKHIGLLLEEYKTTDDKYAFTSDIKSDENSIKNGAILFIQEISKSLKTYVPGANDYWVPADEILDMINNSDPTLLTIYLGLVYQKVNPIKIKESGTLTYGDLIKNMSEAKEFIETIVEQIKISQEELNAIRLKTTIEITLDDYIKYLDASVRVLRIFSDSNLVKNYISSLPDSDMQRKKIELFWKQYDSILEGVNATYSIYVNAKQKNYSLVVSNLRTLYQMRYNSKVLTDNEQIEKINKVISFLIEKGQFISSVAEAKSSEEVYNAIDKFAAPVGSSRTKRLSKSNIALNAYCGLFLGHEQLQKIDDNHIFNTYGITAPIGISISQGHRIFPWPLNQIGKSREQGWSSTWFISLIDIGAIAAYRFTNTTAEQVPTIELKDIVSPGLFWSLGIPKTPLSLNFGAQIGPNLRKVNDTINDYSNTTYIRYSFSIVVDIPLLNLHTNSN